MKNYLLPFAVAFVGFGVLFLTIDTAIMNLQGLSLVFRP